MAVIRATHKKNELFSPHKQKQQYGSQFSI